MKIKPGMKPGMPGPVWTMLLVACMPAAASLSGQDHPVSRKSPEQPPS